MVALHTHRDTQKRSLFLSTSEKRSLQVLSPKDNSMEMPNSISETSHLLFRSFVRFLLLLSTPIGSGGLDRRAGGGPSTIHTTHCECRTRNPAAASKGTTAHVCMPSILISAHGNAHNNGERERTKTQNPLLLLLPATFIVSRSLLHVRYT